MLLSLCFIQRASSFSFKCGLVPVFAAASRRHSPVSSRCSAAVVKKNNLLLPWCYLSQRQALTNTSPSIDCFQSEGREDISAMTYKAPFPWINHFPFYWFILSLKMTGLKTDQQSLSPALTNRIVTKDQEVCWGPLMVNALMTVLEDMRCRQCFKTFCHT